MEINLWNRNHPKRNFNLPVSCIMFLYLFHFRFHFSLLCPSLTEAMQSSLVWEDFSQWMVRLLKQQARRTMKPSQARRMLFMKEVTLRRQKFSAWELNEFLVVLCFQARNTPLQRSFLLAGRMTKRTRVPAPPVYIEPCAGRAHQGVRWLHVLGALFLPTGWIPWKTARCDFPLQCSAAGAKKCV